MAVFSTMDDHIQEINPEILNKILDEISVYTIELVEDPTLPEYGNPYLIAQISKCRHYLNRVQYYLQKCSAHEKNLKKQLLVLKTDIDIKIKNKLADDELVRKQPSITDRVALATAQLAEEHEELGRISSELQDLTETVKIIKMKQRDLQATNNDIKTQRQMIRDDRLTNGNGDGSSSVRNQDGSIPGGMPPVANKAKIDPRDLLDDGKRPDDMPIPKDLAHARQIADFFNSIDKVDPVPSSSMTKKEEETEDSPVDVGLQYEDLLS